MKQSNFIPPSLKFNSSTFQNHRVEFHDSHVYTTVTRSSRVVDDWINFIYQVHHRRLDRLIVGLDTEWCPRYKRYCSSNGNPQPVALLQLCVGSRCLIFQLFRADKIPQSLADFLNEPGFTFVAVGIRNDIEKLSDIGLHVGNAVNLPDLAAEKYDHDWYRNRGLKALVAVILSKEIEKPKAITMSNWSVFSLSKAQIEYACLDAFLSFEIGRALMSPNPPQVIMDI